MNGPGGHEADLVVLTASALLAAGDRLMIVRRLTSSRPDLSGLHP